MLSGFGNFILINPRAGTRTMTDKDTGKEIISNLVASDRVSPRVGVMGLLVAISKMSMSTRGDKFVLKEKYKDDPFRLMGFGHRVYKNFDPRAKIIKKAADEVLSTLGVQDPILAIAKKLEEAALEDEYFKSRNLYPNVDFYSGIIYRALGIPTDMFTVMFAIGRLPGWIAQWKEMRENKEPIGRPRQIYIGHPLREFKR